MNSKFPCPVMFYVWPTKALTRSLSCTVPTESTLFRLFTPCPSKIRESLHFIIFVDPGSSVDSHSLSSFDSLSFFTCRSCKNYRCRACLLSRDGLMDDMRFFVLFNSISVLSGRCLDDNERLCAITLKYI